MGESRSGAWVALLLTASILLVGCAGRKGGPGAPAGGGKAESVGEGMVNVLSAGMGASPAGSSAFFAAPHDAAVLLAPGEKDYAAAADTKMPQWLAFDLGAAREVEAVSITFWSEADRALDFTLQGRKDSRGQWETLATATGNPRATWTARFRPTQVGQVRLEVTRAAGQGRTLIRKLELFAREARPVKNVALTSAGLRVTGSSPFFRAPNDPAAAFSGRLSPPNSNEYAAAQTDGLPDFVEFSLAKAETVGAVGVHWYDDQNYATKWTLEAKEVDAWKPVLTVTDGAEVHGFYLLDSPVSAQTFRLTVTETAGQPRMLARMVALYTAP